MYAVVYLSSKLGQVTGKGLFHVIKDHYSRWLFWPILVARPMPTNWTTTSLTRVGSAKRRKIIDGQNGKLARRFLHAGRATLFQVLRQVPVHLEHCRFVFAEDWFELVVHQDFAAVLRVLKIMRLM
jgi:hypothetical protein